MTNTHKMIDNDTFELYQAVFDVLEQEEDVASIVASASSTRASAAQTHYAMMLFKKYTTSRSLTTAETAEQLVAYVREDDVGYPEHVVRDALMQLYQRETDRLRKREPISPGSPRRSWSGARDGELLWRAHSHVWYRDAAVLSDLAYALDQDAAVDMPGCLAQCRRLASPWSLWIALLVMPRFDMRTHDAVMEVKRILLPARPTAEDATYRALLAVAQRRRIETVQHAPPRPPIGRGTDTLLAALRQANPWPNGETHHHHAWRAGFMAYLTRFNTPTLQSLLIRTGVVRWPARCQHRRYFAHALRQVEEARMQYIRKRAYAHITHPPHIYLRRYAFDTSYPANKAILTSGRAGSARTDPTYFGATDTRFVFAADPNVRACPMPNLFPPKSWTGVVQRTFRAWLVNGAAFQLTHDAAPDAIRVSALVRVFEDRWRHDYTRKLSKEDYAAIGHYLQGEPPFVELPAAVFATVLRELGCTLVRHGRNVLYVHGLMPTGKLARRHQFIPRHKQKNSRL